jgi:hypothetical protein
LTCFWRTSDSFFIIFSSVVSHGGQPAPSAVPGGNPPEDGQSAVGWVDAGYEPGTTQEYQPNRPTLLRSVSQMGPLPYTQYSVVSFKQTHSTSRFSLLRNVNQSRYHYQTGPPT